MARRFEFPPPNLILKKAISIFGNHPWRLDMNSSKYVTGLVHDLSLPELCDCLYNLL